MVQIRFHADSSPLLSHGGEWPHPDTVAQWLNAAAIVLETETLLIRSAGSFIAALAMADFDSANHADDFSYVGRRLSPSDIHHWLEASSALLLLLTTKSNATSLARPVHLHVGALATRNIGAADHTPAQTVSVADGVHDYLRAVTVLLATNISAINGSQSTSSGQIVPSMVGARTLGVMTVPLVDSAGFAVLFFFSLCVAIAVGFASFIVMLSRSSYVKSVVLGLPIDGGGDSLVNCSTSAFVTSSSSRPTFIRVSRRQTQRQLTSSFCLSSGSMLSP